MTKNMTASVRQRLLNISRQTGEPFQNVLVRYGIERLLYRISNSPYASSVVLKGANLFYAWTGQLHRPTKDLDVLHFGDAVPESLKKVFVQIVSTEVQDDGLIFDTEDIVAEYIRETSRYSGVRIRLKGRLGSVVIPIQIDVGLGDSVYPEAEDIAYPTLLDLPAPHVRAYRFETAIAEKFEAMVKLDMSNSRMKDFYDIFILARDFEFDGALLQQSIRRTFERRATAITSAVPGAWTEVFTEDPGKQVQWRAFLHKSKLDTESLPEVVAAIRRFLGPVYESLGSGLVFMGKWSAGQWE